LYRDIVQLPPHRMGPHNFAIGAETILSIQHHSQVSGPTKEPSRVIIDLWVRDIAAEQARLEAQGVQFSRSQGVEYWGGVISTFNDPDGNTVQLIQHNPELRTSATADAARPAEQEIRSS
jgi:predicted enzyme related to lactoylglutathione lyase